MAKRRIWLTQFDANRLAEWLRVVGRRHARDRDNLDVLRAELRRAQLVGAQEVPPDVVTMRSCVRLVDPSSDQEMRCTLVFPEDAIPAEERISVLAPLGAAILGCRAGDVVRFQAPGGWRTVRIAEVLYQPEAAGRFDL